MLFWISFFWLALLKPGPPVAGNIRMDGITLVAPPKPFPSDPFPEIRKTGASWVAIAPFAFCRKGSTEVRYNVSGYQWWGERPEGVRESIRLARKNHLKVMLKPHVWVPGAWSGEIDFSSETAWKAWEASYAKYILHFARMADSLDVELFCIGVECKASTRSRPAFWQQLIREVRQVYSGKLTYAANWDEFQQIRFWKDLDYIGIDAYFPLLEEQTPSVDRLQKAWQPVLRRLDQLAATWKRDLVFTEFGYLSVDGCAGSNWLLEPRIDRLNVNQVAQAHALEALFAVCSARPWWQGGFLWKWFPHMQGHEGYPEKDYTPQGKLGEKVLSDWYRR